MVGTRSMLTFSTMEMVTVEINGGLEVRTSYHWMKEGKSRRRLCRILAGYDFEL
jgi:hypothetical protein